ncbi:MAG: DUF1707 domain-containing protein [Propioniciclava sp.]
MPELPRSSRYVATPGATLNEAERADLVERLNAAYAAGAIPAEAYEQHLDALFSASTLGEVAPVVSLLPTKPTHKTPEAVPVGEGQPGELAPLRSPRQLPWLAPVLGAVAVAVLVLVILLIVL